jgi:hypothetical protein
MTRTAHSGLSPPLPDAAVRPVEAAIHAAAQYSVETAIQSGNADEQRAKFDDIICFLQKASR